jgi:hypothetical protein
VPKPSEERILAAGRAAVQYMHGLGITAWLDAEASKAILATYRRLAESGELNSHVAALPVTPRDIPPSTGKTAHVILEQVAVILRQVFSQLPKVCSQQPTRVCRERCECIGVQEPPHDT